MLPRPISWAMLGVRPGIGILSQVILVCRQGQEHWYHQGPAVALAHLTEAHTFAALWCRGGWSQVHLFRRFHLMLTVGGECR